ncbi:MAG: hypothetical protein AAB759_01030 [Patescibacteria group bacterium]
MTEPVKQLIAVAAAILLSAVGYYGNYLPLAKSQSFIDTMRKANSGQYRTVAEFENGFRAVLDAPSPIGQEELVRNLGSIVMSAVGGSANNPKVIEELIKFISEYYDPIIQSGRGMSSGQNVFVMGSINQLAGVRTKDPRYFEAAKRYYLRGLESAPIRPQYLYGLFDVYRNGGDIENAKLIGERILSIWPTDDRLQKILDDFLAASAQPTSTKKTGTR